MQIKEYLKHLKIQKAENTYITYVRSLKRFLKWLSKRNIQIENVNDDVMQSYIDYLIRKGQAAQSVRFHYSAIEFYYKYLKRKIKFRMFDRPHLPKIKTKPVPDVSDQTIELFKEAIQGMKEPYRTVLLLICNTGLRVNEICSLQLSNLENVNGIFQIRVIGKGNKTRIIPLNEEAKTDLSWYLSECRENKKGNWLFPLPGNDKRPIQSFTLRHHIRITTNQFEYLRHISPHILRHYFATKLHKNGQDPLVISKLLGHESISTTAVYTHPDSEKLLEAVNSI